MGEHPHTLTLFKVVTGPSPLPEDGFLASHRGIKGRVRRRGEPGLFERLESGDPRQHRAVAGEVLLFALHKLTSAREIEFSQDGPGARCWFQIKDLDAWRRSKT